MLHFRIRQLRFTERLALCVVAVPLFVLSSRWVRADPVCNHNQEHYDWCTLKGGGPCSEFTGSTKANCEGHKQRQFFQGNFFCSDYNTRPYWVCVPAVNTATCYRDYDCVWSPLVASCTTGPLFDSQSHALYTSQACSEPDPGS